MYHLPQKVKLALEAGYLEKVDELCERHSLCGLVRETGMEIYFDSFP